MKSLPQVWREYLKSRNNKKFSVLEITDNKGIVETFLNVSNFHKTEDEGGKWIEFDCKSIHNPKGRHVKMHGHITKEITLIED